VSGDDEFSDGRSHPFYTRLNHGWPSTTSMISSKVRVNHSMRKSGGRPGLPPGMYFRLLLIGDFEMKDGRIWRIKPSARSIWRPGAIVGVTHCRIVEKLRGGGMGVVYKPEDVKLQFSSSRVPSDGIARIRWRARLLASTSTP
jgi:hypothetical protein